MANLCNVNGVITAEEDARIPVLDRGFLFGDSIYEVVRTLADVPFCWSQHWHRLQASAAALGMPLDLDEATVAGRVAATLAAARNEASYVRIVVSRGTGTAPSIDLAKAPGPPSWVVLVRSLPAGSGQPVRLAVVDRLRNDRRALDPATKSGNYLNNVLALAEAQARGATDCIMLNGQGLVTEASTANVFAKIAGRWCTPSADSGILIGVTRGLLIEFLRQRGETVDERALRRSDLDAAEELLLSSTLRDIAPVTHLDGRALHRGGAGPRTSRLMPAFVDHLARRHATVDVPAWQRLLEGAG